jgi:hypothetical protein
MLTYIFIAILVIAWVWIAYEIIHAPTLEEPEDDDDPTTTFWHEDN